MPDEKLVLIDIDIMHWTVFETRLYRKAVGVNPEFAIGSLQRAADESAAEAQREFGEAEPPEDWIPLAVLNIDPAYLLGFAWIVARRAAPSLTFDAYAAEIESGALMRAFYGGLAEEVEDESPFEKPAATKPRKTSSASKRPSVSASSTAGD